MRSVNDWSEQFEKYVKKKFKKIPHADRWSINAQIAVVVVGVVPPIMFITIWLIMFIWVSFKNHQINQKYENLNKK